MAKALVLVNGIPRMQNTFASSYTIYDKTITIVSGTPGSNELQYPVVAGTDITLPNSGSYTGDQLQVFLNGVRVDDVLDYNHVSSTQIEFLFDLQVGDLIRFYMDRPA